MRLQVNTLTFFLSIAMGCQQRLSMSCLNLAKLNILTSLCSSNR